MNPHSCESDFESDVSAVSPLGQLGWGSTIRTYTTRSKVEGSTVKLFPTEVADPMILADLARFDWGSGQDPPQVGIPDLPIFGKQCSPNGQSGRYCQNGASSPSRVSLAAEAELLDCGSALAVSATLDLGNNRCGRYNSACSCLQAPSWED